MKKSLSFSDLWAFKECPQQFLARKQRRARSVNAYQAMGDAAHALYAAPDREAAESEVVKHLAVVPEQERKAARQRVEALAQVADDMADDDEVKDREKETTIRFFDEKSGWWLFAKPDEVSLTMGRFGREVVQVLDIKTGGRLKEKQVHQLYFFGLVASLERGYSGPVRLVVRLLAVDEKDPAARQRLYRSVDSVRRYVRRSLGRINFEVVLHSGGADVVFWYSPKLTQPALSQARSVMRSIEAAYEKNSFPAKTGWHCEGCPFKGDCLAYQKRAATASRRLTVMPVRRNEETA